MATLMPNGKQAFTRSDGTPLVGGKLFTYDAGTSTPRPTYADADALFPNTNPVILDARGEATVFWSGAYKVVLKDASDVTIWTVDDIVSTDSVVGDIYSDFANAASPTKGAGLVGYSDAQAYAAATVGGRLNALSTGSVTQKLYGVSSISRTPTQRFGDVVDLDDWLNGDGVTNNDTAFDALLTYMNANPGKTYRSRNGRVYACTFNSKTIPGTARLRLEGAKFLWSGALGASAAVAIDLAAGCDFDALRFEVVSGASFRRLIQTEGCRGDLIELVCQAQVNNNGGSNLDFGVRLFGQGFANKIGEIRTRKVDRAITCYGDSGTAATAQTGSRIEFIDVQDYVAGFYPRNLKDFQLAGYLFRGRSPNALPDPGHNGIVTAGLQDAQFGPGTVKDSGEHGIRIGGTNGTETLTSRVTFTSPTTFGSGQCGFKAWSGSNAQLLKNITVTGGQFIDSGDDGDPLGFNDFGMMIQAVSEGMFEGCQVLKEDSTYCALDGVYISQADRVHLPGLVVNGAQRNSLRISEFNGNGTDPNGSNTVNVWGAHLSNHLAEGVYLDNVGTDFRDIMVDRAHIIGGTDGIKWAGAAARAAQPCFFSAFVRGQSGAALSFPVGANLHSLNIFTNAYV